MIGHALLRTTFNTLHSHKTLWHNGQHAALACWWPGVQLPDVEILLWVNANWLKISLVKLRLCQRLTHHRNSPTFCEYQNYLL